MCGGTAGAFVKILQSREMEAAGLPLGMFETCLRFAGLFPFQVVSLYSSVLVGFFVFVLFFLS